ncbi:MAG: ABC transporter ATP-binding protein [Proteobacteria bacterium]|jgi:ABC-2 type transport system ATP-binding protein|nr:ABC transporter ATP-binding protein [Pseudomonadota bacterium]
MTAIFCKSLVKEYQVAGKVSRVLDVENLEIKEGSFFGILGQNGAGKSTLINIITSLVSPTSGCVEIFGKNIASNVEFAKTSIGTAVQDIKLDPFPLVWEAMEYQAGYYGIPKNKRKTDELLHNLGLYEHRNKKARMLSGGMQRRLIIAKALVHDPKIIILDEPTAGVDIELRTSMWNFVRDLHKKGKTVIITTHYLEEVQELCTEIAFIKGGKIILQDKKTNVLSILDKKTIVIKTPSQVQNFTCEGVEAVSYDGDFLKVNFAPSKISAIALLEKLKANGVDIQDITIKDAHLDEIFSYIINR